MEAGAADCNDYDLIFLSFEPPVQGRVHCVGVGQQTTLAIHSTLRFLYTRSQSDFIQAAPPTTDSTSRERPEQLPS